MIELVGLSGKEESYPNELSGGQQQRVGIARSLAADPELWILDEPFSALDPLIRRDMQDEFLRLQKMLNKTIIFITHDFDEAIKLADRIAIMKDGQIEQVGTAEDLVLSPATAYVREFTKTIPRIRVVRAGSLASRWAADEPLGETIQGGAILDSVLCQALTSTLPLRVVAEDGRPLGALRRETVLDEIDRLSVTR
jgi:glycine betaine/proline transport system ATP-binding protein